MPKIISVGLEIPSEAGVECVTYNSTRSLQDADLVLFKPGTSKYPHFNRYNGKANFRDASAAALKKERDHWRKELDLVLKANRVCILFLALPVEVYVDSGKREYSGTGKNRHETVLIEEFSSYDYIPFELPEIRAAHGYEIKPGKAFSVISRWWSVFGSSSPYSCYFERSVGSELLLTKSGQGFVGCGARLKTGGNVLFLPPPQVDVFIASKGGASAKKKDLITQFGHMIVSEAVNLGATFLKGVPETAPDWATASEYDTSEEARSREALLAVEAEVASAALKANAAREELKVAGKYRPLLWGRSQQLENAVRGALELLGFHAEPFIDGESEFDVVFVSGEGRFIGECEGKDSKAVNVDKFRQLESNVTEDLAREETSTPAKGVLFGNGHRLSPPTERLQSFTKKCVSSAEIKNIALVSTPDLYEVCKALIDRFDPDYAKSCRQALLETNGLVTFPLPPSPPQAVSGKP